MLPISPRFLFQTSVRYFTLAFGMFIIANGIVLTVNAELGVNPWDVLHIGLSNLTGLSMGQVIQGTGLIAIIASIAARIKISIGTFLSMILHGLFVDLIFSLGYLPQADHLLVRLLMFVFGTAFFGLGVAFYISANLGAGPRDGLMLALTRLTGQKVGVVKTGIEITAATSGYLLGGPLGLGTVIFALSIGMFIEFGFKIVKSVKANAYYCKVWFGC